MPSRLRVRLRSPRSTRSARLRPVLAPRRRAVAALTATALAALALPPALSGGSAEAADKAPRAPFDQQILFKASQDPGYSCFRIPAIVKTVKGTLLAFAEGRVNDCSDAGDIDLVLKRSEDGGRTWSPMQVINEGGGDTHGNPAPVVDVETGRVVLAETYNPGRTDGKNCEVPCERTPYMQYSDDDGETWSKPRDLSDDILPESWNSWYATGPVHGIQLTRGRHAGRLVFTVNAETWNGSRVTENHAALVVSDDGGDSWRIGATDSYPISASDATFRQKPSEMTLTERHDGSVYVSGREQDGTDLGHRDHAVSRDGGESFTGPFVATPDLYTPQVQGSTLRFGNRLLLACPGDPDRRRTMMIRSSFDGGRTWDSFDRGTVVTGDWSGYSDMVGIDDDRVGLMYEGGVGNTQPQVWLRGEPANNRVTGLITTREGGSPPRSVSLSTDSAHNDGQWHHVALRRGDGELTLFLDGEPLSRADIPGSVSRNSPFGVHVGQRLDSRAHFTGAIDEVGVFERALSDAEVSRLSSGQRTASAVTWNTVTWLPMDRVRAGN
ncbi:exo-alpha-sialidase [Streptomyces lasiicapitis]|uniref:exo-alpha-sialidase n=1 Tax=Streptomyces lasiicapitis TaxID=1923961 RepID=UPI00368986E5